MPEDPVARRKPTKKAPATKASAPAARPSDGWTPAELAVTRAGLSEHLSQLKAEYEHSLADLNTLRRANSDGAGDDQADAGSKTFDREQEQSIAANRFNLINQVERAIARIDAGSYGRCEVCGEPIPRARLEVFPMATLDVTCKQREERR